MMRAVKVEAHAGWWKEAVQCYGVIGFITVIDCVYIFIIRQDTDFFLCFYRFNTLKHLVHI